MSMCYWCRRSTYCQAMEKALYKSVNDGVMYCEIFNPVALPPLSMSHTTPAWVNEEKTVTRRNWSIITMRKFRNDTYYMAWSRQRQFGGQPLGIGKLTEDPFRERTGVNTGDKSAEMYEAEGFLWLDVELNKRAPLLFPLCAPLGDACKRWIEADITLAVVPFEVLEVFPGMKEKYSTDEEIIRCVKALVKAIA